MEETNAKGGLIRKNTTQSSSSPNSEFSILTTMTPVSRKIDENGSIRPNYMSMTEATKAKQRGNRAQKQCMDEFQLLKKSIFACSDPSMAPMSRSLCMQSCRGNC